MGRGRSKSPVPARRSKVSAGKSNHQTEKVETSRASSESTMERKNVDKGDKGVEAVQKEDNVLGITFDGQRVFKLPKAVDSWTFISQLNSMSSVIAVVFYCFSLGLALTSSDEHSVLVLAIVWRLIYNAVVGRLLYRQSKTQSITNWVKQVQKQPFSRAYSWMASVLRGLEKDESLEETPPPEFIAWVFWRSFVGIVESNDTLAFVLTALIYGLRTRLNVQLPLVVKQDYSNFGYNISDSKPQDYMNAEVVFGNEFLIDVAGIMLVILSMYCTLFARRKTGEYGWYWGDFFFLRMDFAQLVYDGIFELLPHPMYTAGYFWTYGLALIARSKAVLFLALFYHLSQLIFLWLVENPHIEHLYGGQEPRVPSEYKTANVFLIKNFDVYRASDINLVMTIVFLVCGMQVGSVPGGPLDSDDFHLAFALGWQVLSTILQAMVLLKQEKYRNWTNHFLEQGYSENEAFESWKRFLNMLLTLQVISFLICAKRFFYIPTSHEEIHFLLYLAQILFGVILIMISMWTFQAAYLVLGDYGWFYGDFFLSPIQLRPSNSQSSIQRSMSRNISERKGKTSSSTEDAPSEPSDNGDESEIQFEDHSPSYDGIYRYMNNPIVYLGHFWMYGVSAICFSSSLFAVALLSHVLKIYLLYAVEKPHFRRIYKTRRKSSTAIGQKVRTKAKEVQNSDTAVFLANWVRHPIETGAIAPSSQQLAVAMCDTMNIGPGSVVVELGPGTGPFTEEILHRMQGKGTYIGFELSEEFIKKLRDRFPENKTDFICRSAEDIGAVLKEKGIKHCDCVLSGLPWAIFSAELQQRIINQVVTSLKTGGRFATFAYLQGLVMPAGQNFRSLLSRNFDKVERSNIVWKNLPPAFVYRCEKVA